MLQIKNKNYFNNIFFCIALLSAPILAIAPIGIWIPLILGALIILPISRGLLISLKKNELFKVLTVAFLWILLSIFLIVKNINFLEKFLHFFILIMAGTILSKSILKITKFDKIITVFAISFLLSSFLIIIDLKFSLGLKLWMSKNFDSGNFEKFYKLKSWIDFSDFRNQESNLIITYLKSSYDRGAIALTILALPLYLMCYNYKRKILAFIVLTTSIFLVFLNLNLTIFLNFFVSAPIALFYYYKINIFKKYFFFLLTIYFISSPFILGQLEYENYSYYENNFLEKSFFHSKTYCDTNLYNENKVYYSNYNIYLKCGTTDTDYSIVKDNEKFNLEKKSDKTLIFLNHKIYQITAHKIHRLIIWSYAKEKIMDKPFAGHGFFSSRYMSQELRQTLRGTNYQFMPLHPHNSILQVWLELGIIGIIIFLVFIKVLLNKIYFYHKKNSLTSALALFSFLQILVTGQIAYGFWQIWWIATIIIIFILYTILFYNIRPDESRSNSLN